ncbi:MAG TPA: TraR/DksA C4-type zinc finger protein [Acidimicrobiales bacterium]|nr:TraR/DksA C4-type zinc finger protein [Acidimicrobiales bacterium]
MIDLLAQAEADVAALDAALAGVDAGTYGACEGCGGHIGDERLAAHPTTTNCMACAQESAAATSSVVRATLKSGVPGSKRRPSASEPAS